MLTREEIINQLNHDPHWTPKPEASDEEWRFFEEILAEQEDLPNEDDELEELAEPWEEIEDKEIGSKAKDEDW